MSGRYTQKLVVLPFVIGPAGRLQQTMLVAPAVPFDLGHSFVGKLSQFTVVERALSALVPQVQWFKRHLVISLTIQTTAVESFSGRAGLNVTFGALIPPHQLSTPALAERTFGALRRYFRRAFNRELGVQDVTSVLDNGDTSAGSWAADSLVSTFEQEFGFDTESRVRTFSGWWGYLRARARLRRISSLRAFESLNDVSVFFEAVDNALTPFSSTIDPAADSIRHSSLLIATTSCVALFGAYAAMFATSIPPDLRVVMLVCSAGAASLTMGETVRCFRLAAGGRASITASCALAIAGATAVISLVMCVYAAYLLWMAR